MDFLGNWIFWGYFIVWIPFMIFVLLYGLRSPWKDSPAGRGIMLMSGSIALVLTQTLLTLMLGDWHGRNIVRITVFLGVGASGWYQLHTLIRLQYRGRKLLDEKAQRDAPAEGVDHSRAGRRLRELS